MKKILMMAAIALMTALSMSVTSCADAEEGESWGDWDFRNYINCTKYTEWSLYKVMDAKGNWVEPENVAFPKFNVQFFASDHNFHSTKATWIEDDVLGLVVDESSIEEYTPSDNTAFTVDSKKLTIEGTVGGTKYFSIVLDEKPGSSFMKGKLHFYKENKTYNVQLIR